MEGKFMIDLSLDEHRNVSLCEVLDRVLSKGAVISGEVAISVADVELIKLGLQLVIASAGNMINEEYPT
jgi:hypothetical protein